MTRKIRRVATISIKIVRCPPRTQWQYQSTSIQFRKSRLESRSNSTIDWSICRLWFAVCPNLGLICQIRVLKIACTPKCTKEVKLITTIFRKPAQSGGMFPKVAIVILGRIRDRKSQLDRSSKPQIIIDTWVSKRTILTRRETFNKTNLWSIFKSNKILASKFLPNKLFLPKEAKMGLLNNQH